MTSKEFVRGVETLIAAFPASKVELKNNTLKIWFEALHDLEGGQFRSAIVGVVKKAKFFPTVAEIREEAKLFRLVEKGPEMPKITLVQQEKNRIKSKELLTWLENRTWEKAS